MAAHLVVVPRARARAYCSLRRTLFLRARFRADDLRASPSALCGRDAVLSRCYTTYDHGVQRSRRCCLVKKKKKVRAFHLRAARLNRVVHFLFYGSYKASSSLPWATTTRPHSWNFREFSFLVGPLKIARLLHSPSSLHERLIGRASHLGDSCYFQLGHVWLSLSSRFDAFRVFDVIEIARTKLASLEIEVHRRRL